MSEESSVRKPSKRDTSRLQKDVDLYEEEYDDEGPSDYDSEDLEREVMAAQAKKKLPKEKILTKKELKA